MEFKRLAAFTVLSIFFFVNVFSQDSLRYGPENYKQFYGDHTELIMVYIGAQSCGPCHNPKVKKMIEEFKLDLFKTAKNQGKSFSVIGVANDFSLDEGWKFLKSSGYFDEVIIGKNWRNSGSIQFFWNQEDIIPAMPTVIVFERPVYDKSYGYEFGEPSIIAHTIIGGELVWDENTMSFLKNK